MSSQVIPRRFINTPTVGEVYKEEHPEATLDIAEEDVEALSKEYDQADRTGTEGYYKLLFEHIHQAHKGTPHNVAGNEGIVSWVKDMVSGFIEAIKKFFKWVYGWFSGKKEAVEKKATSLSDRLKEHGVKTGDIPYPKSYTDLWGKPTKVPNSLDWMNAALDAVLKAMDESKKHKAEYRKFAEDIQKSLTGSGTPFISQFKGTLDKRVAAHGKAVQAIFGAKDGQWSQWAGIGLVNVGNDGKVSISVKNKILPNKGAQPTFKTNTSKVESLRTKMKTILDRWGEQVKDTADLENITLKQMNKSMDWASSVELVNQKAAQAIVAKIKKTVSDMMVTIKAEDNLFVNLTMSGYAILSASVNDSGQKEGEKPDAS